MSARVMAEAGREEGHREPEIAVVNGQRRFSMDAAFWKEVGRKLVQKVGSGKWQEISIVWVGESRMRKLKRHYFGKAVLADVLSFDLEESLEIIICLAQADRQAIFSGVSLEEEVLRLLVHGFLHGLGFTDDTLEARAVMWKEQEQWVSWLKKNLPWKHLNH